jgi:hypothetical protein
MGIYERVAWQTRLSQPVSSMLLNTSRRQKCAEWVINKRLATGISFPSLAHLQWAAQRHCLTPWCDSCTERLPKNKCPKQGYCLLFRDWSDRRLFSTRKNWLHPGLCWPVATRHEDEPVERGWICYSAREWWVGSLDGCRVGHWYFHVAEHDLTCPFILIRCSEGEQEGWKEQWLLLMFIYNTVRSRTH